MSLTLTQGVVTAARVEVEATSPTALQFQTQFAARYADQVISKSVSEAQVSRVAGASLTSVGFNDALTRIEVSARD